MVKRTTRVVAVVTALVLVSAVTAACSSGSGEDEAATEEDTEELVHEVTVRSVDEIPKDPVELAAEAYVAGYPLVVSTRTLQYLGGLVGVNSLFWQQELSGPQSRTIVGPNRDTLYSVSVVDLRAGPLVLTLPEVTDRYFTYQFLDTWTESPHYIGTRATEGRAGTWVIAPPGWEGDGPDGAEVLEMTTPQFFLLGRYLVDDEVDVENVMAIRDEASLEPLTGTGPPPELGEAPGIPQAVPADTSFYEELDVALAINPPVTEYQRELFRRFDEMRAEHDGGDPSTSEILEAGADEGAARIAAMMATTGDDGPEWKINLDVGRYGDDVELRALVARIGWGANVPEEAVYPLATTSADGAELDGTNTYRITFPADGLPPVEGFWSLSVYAGDMFFADHPAGRWNIGDRYPDLEFGPDGELEITLAHTEPDDASNWLPVPEGRFVLMLRLYLPGDAILDGTYELPSIERVG